MLFFLSRLSLRNSSLRLRYSRCHLRNSGAKSASPLERNWTMFSYRAFTCSRRSPSTMSVNFWSLVPGGALGSTLRCVSRGWNEKHDARNWYRDSSSKVNVIACPMLVDSALTW